MQAAGKLGQCHVHGRDVEDDHQLSDADEEQEARSARTYTRAMRWRRARGGIGVVAVPMVGAIAVAVGRVVVMAVVMAVAVVLAVAVQVGEVLAEGLAVVWMGHVGLRS